VAAVKEAGMSLMFDGAGPRKRESSQDPYHDIFRMANDGIIVIQDGKIVFVNPAFARMLGYEHTEMLGMSFESILDPVASHLYKEKQEQFVFGELERPSFRARFLNSDKRALTAEVSTADFVFNGQPAIIVLVRDVSHRLELESAVEQSESRYRMLFESSPIAYFTLSAHGIIQGVNHAAEKLLGFKSDELLHRSILSLIPKESADAERAKLVLSDVLQARAVRDAEMRLCSSNGEAVWVSITSGVLPENAQSTTIGLMAFDIRQRKAAEERETVQRDRLNLFLEVTTHDLNNVNQTLLFATGLLELSPSLSDDQKQLIRQSSWNVRRAARMIANLKLLISLRDNPPPTTKVDPYEPLQRAIIAVQRDFPWKRINIMSNLRPETFYLAAHSEIEIVFFNIIHNSATYDERESIDIDISVQKSQPSDTVRFEFCDRGPGIPDSLKESIFKRSGSPSMQVVGRGLGLTLVDAIVRGLGGKIWVEDCAKGNPSEGARFIALFPRWVDEISRPCGKQTCITFYKSDNCLFCENSYETIVDAMQEFGIPTRMVEVINVDDPRVEVPENDVPMVPLVRFCKDREFTGLLSIDQMRSAVLELIMKPCYREAIPTSS